jgi:lipase
MTLHLRSFGEGPRPAVALHCSLAQGGVWAGVAAGLPGVTMLAPDLPGHGRSPDWDGTSDFHSLTTREVLAVMGGPCDLIGHSFGATVALRIALERPELVRTLTLVEPVLFAAARAAGSPAFRDYLTQNAAFADLYRAGNKRAAAEAFQAVWGGGVALSALPAHLQDYIVQRIDLIVAGHPALEGDSAGLLAHGRLESLGIPVLLVEGGTSPSVIGAIQDELARRLPQVTRIVVPGAAHMVPITHPAPVAAAIAALTA